MKKYIINIIVLLLIEVSGFAQVSELPENISPLLIGEIVPDLEVLNSKGHSINLLDDLKNKPSVLIFYRGGWCPFCNMQLSEINGIQDSISELGYQIIAISPDDPKNLIPTDDRHDLRYKLYSDLNGDLIEGMGIAFYTDEVTSKFISSRSEGKPTSILPVPSVFIVNQDGTIVFEYIAPDYKKRISAELLLAVLRTLDKG